MPYKDPEREKEYRREYRKRNPDKMKKYQKEYAIKHKIRLSEQKKEYFKKYKEENPERVKETKKKYKMTHVEKIQEYNKEYNARSEVRIRTWCYQTLNKHKNIKKYEVKISVNELNEYAKRAKTCKYCERDLNWSPYLERTQINSPTLDRVNNGKILDHIWKGPTDSSEGAVEIVCYRCNMSKSNRTYDEFIAYCRHIIKSHEDRQV